MSRGAVGLVDIDFARPHLGWRARIARGLFMTRFVEVGVSVAQATFATRVGAHIDAA